MRLKAIIIFILASVSAWAQIPTLTKGVDKPQIPARQLILSELGAVGDGEQVCTKTFQSAIDSLNHLGGGHLIVPSGVWLTGPITLCSHIDLHLEKGAIILFAADEALYPIVSQTYEGQMTQRCQSPISGSNLTDVSITGYGIIDGNGDYWRPVKRSKVTEGEWKALLSKKDGKLENKDLWLPSLGKRHLLRPVMISLTNCKRVILQGVTFQNSPAWNIHPLMCEDMTIDNITVYNPEYAQNGDGIDLESCKNVIMTNSRFSTGDDAICLKSGKDAEGRKRGKPTEDVLIDGCTVFHGHGGFVIGSEMSGGVYNVLAQNCLFSGTGAGIRIKAGRGRGGVVRNITVKNISMNNIQGDAITIDMYYGGKPEFEVNGKGEKVNVTKPASVDETTPEFRDIDIEDIVCHGAKRAIFINGLPEMPIHHITLNNISITADIGVEYYFSKELNKNRVKIILNGK